LERIAQLPWQLLQRMRDPEEWFNNIFRFANHNLDYPIRSHPETSKIQVDTFLFPSTWKPLRILICLVVVQAICVTLSATFLEGATHLSPRSSFSVHRDRVRIMKSFIVQQTVHNEWYRIFVKERRVALGAIISLVGLLALVKMMHAVAVVDRLVALALMPALIASVVTSYMNAILYSDHYLPSAPARSSRSWDKLSTTVM